MFCLKLLMMMIMKALLLLYIIDLSTIHEAWNVKVLYAFEKPAYFYSSFVSYDSFLITKLGLGW